MTYLHFVSRTAGPEIVPPQTYDYEALNSFALQDGSTAAEKGSNEDGNDQSTTEGEPGSDGGMDDGSGDDTGIGNTDGQDD